MVDLSLYCPLLSSPHCTALFTSFATLQVGVYCLYAKLSDRAEALESLKATTVWHSGLPTPKVCVSSNQLESFLSGGAVKEEPLVRGQRASFLVHSEFVMAGQATQNWMMVAEVEQTHGGISALQQTLASEGSGITALVDADIAKGTANMKRIMGAADGFQCLQDEATSTHHYANVMFNCMRGGIYDNNYEVSKKVAHPGASTLAHPSLSHLRLVGFWLLLGQSPATKGGGAMAVGHPPARAVLSKQNQCKQNHASAFIASTTPSVRHH